MGAFESSRHIKTRVEGNKHQQSVSQWVENIKEALRELGVTMDESDWETKAINARDKAIEMERLWNKGLKPANTRRVEELETVKMLGQDISWGGSNSYALLSLLPQAVS